MAARPAGGCNKQPDRAWRATRDAAMPSAKPARRWSLSSTTIRPASLVDRLLYTLPSSRAVRHRHRHRRRRTSRPCYLHHVGRNQRRAQESRLVRRPPSPEPVADLHVQRTVHPRPPLLQMRPPRSRPRRSAQARPPAEQLSASQRVVQLRARCHQLHNPQEYARSRPFSMLRVRLTFIQQLDVPVLPIRARRLLQRPRRLRHWALPSASRSPVQRKQPAA